MIQLALATLLANPCMAPVHHKPHTVTPVQSCVVPAVPMCFRDPAPIDIEPVPAVYPYFIDPGVDDESGEGVDVDQGEPETSSSGVVLGVSGLSSVVSGGGSGGYSPPPPRAQAPELSAAGTIPAVVLLLGTIAVIGGKKS